MKYSLTMAGVLTSLVGYLARYIGVPLTEVESQALVDAISALVTIVGITTAWYGRYRQGDINLMGSKKK